MVAQLNCLWLFQRNYMLMVKEGFYCQADKQEATSHDNSQGLWFHTQMQLGKSWSATVPLEQWEEGIWIIHISCDCLNNFYRTLQFPCCLVQVLCRVICRELYVDCRFITLSKNTSETKVVFMSLLGESLICRGRSRVNGHWTDH